MSHHEDSLHGNCSSRRVNDDSGSTLLSVLSASHVRLHLQVMIYEVLNVWGQEGLETHVKKMQTEYKERAAIVQKAAGMAVFVPCMCHGLSNVRVALEA